MQIPLGEQSRTIMVVRPPSLALILVRPLPRGPLELVGMARAGLFARRPFAVSSFRMVLAWFVHCSILLSEV
jgi:hypothetical protein